MYCVFLETGNDVFLSHITDTFCEKAIQSIVALYKNGEFTGSTGLYDKVKTEEYLKKNESAIFFINCSQYPNIPCGNAGCRTKHITALASNQLKILDASMTNKKNNFAKSSDLPDMQKLYIQRLFQAYETANKQSIQEIEIPRTKKHDEYLRTYIKKTNWLKREADKFIYVRDQVASDYDYFEEHSNLPNREACCALQAI